MARILFLDIETAPNTAYVWGLFDQNIAHDHLVESSFILCWTAKWLGGTSTLSEDCQDRKNYRPMMERLYGLLDAADIVVHYYGSKFDIPTVNKEFVKLGIKPPSPYKQVDLKVMVAKVFRFESNKLDYVAEQLGFGKKMETEFSLWVDCMNNDPKAWAYMIRYNRHDVVLLEKLYHKLTPWIPKHPNLSAFRGDLCCPKCGSKSIQSRGIQVAVLKTYTRYHCQSCGGWFRGSKATPSKGERGINV